MCFVNLDFFKNSVSTDFCLDIFALKIIICCFFFLYFFSRCLKQYFVENGVGVLEFINVF